MRFSPLLLLILFSACSGGMLSIDREHGDPGTDPPGPITTPPEPAPSETTIEYFKAAQATLVSGESTTIQWRVKEADQVSLEPGFGPVDPEGEKTVAPTETTTYILSVVKKEVTTKVALTIGVVTEGPNIGDQPPPEKTAPEIAAFTVLPSNTVLSGSKIEIYWNVSNAEEVIITPQGGEAVHKTDLSGVTEFTVNKDSWFVLTAKNGEKEATASVSIVTQNSICLLQENCATSKGLEEGIGFIYYSPFACATPEGHPMLFVPDAANHRVAIYTEEDMMKNRPSVFLGQPNGTSIAPNQGRTKPGLDTLNEPRAVWSNCKDKIAVADQLDHRVLLWDGIPSQSGTAAHYVLGQPHGQTGTPNRGSTGIVAGGFNRPSDVWYDETAQKLFVADTNNHRVMMYDGWPPSDGVRIEDGLQTNPVALGQRNTESVNASDDWSTTTPRGVSTFNGKVLVADSGNHRILVYDLAGTGVNRIANDGVHVITPITYLGQSSPSNKSSELAANRFNNPQRVYAYDVPSGMQIWVSDAGNNRALRFSNCNFDANPFCSNADLVLGANDFTTAGKFAVVPDKSGMGGCTLGPIVGDKLYSCSYSYRILIYEKPSSWVAGQNNPQAGAVIGQPNEKTKLPNFAGAAVTRGDQQMAIANVPSSVFADEKATFIADGNNNRVLIYKGIPKTTGAPADLVLGQANFSENFANRNGPVGANTLNWPQSVFATATHLFVADTSNRRVLIWKRDENGLPVGDPVPLGQADLTSNHFYNNTEIAGMSTSNRGACAFVTPYSVASDGTRLFVANARHNRVSIWNTIPTDPLTPADIVLGQANCVSTNANRGKDYFNSTSVLPTAQTLYSPKSVFVKDGILVVADYGNNRVVGYTLDGLSDGAAASFVIGQADFTSMGANAGSGSVNGAGLNFPYTAVLWKESVAVADYFNNRVLFFDRPLTGAGGSAHAYVIGQDNLTSNLQNKGGSPSGDTLFLPNGLFIDQDTLFVTEYGNQRLLMKHLPASL